MSGQPCSHSCGPLLLFALTGLVLACDAEPGPLASASDDAWGSASSAQLVSPAMAASEGIAWMIEHADEMTPSWRYAFFSRLHRIVSDPKTSARIKRILVRHELAHRPMGPVGNFELTAALHPLKLTPVLFELLRRRELSLEHQMGSEAIEARIALDEDAFWADVKPVQQALFLHVFNSLEIDTRHSLEAMIAEVRLRSEQEPVAELGSDPFYLYTLKRLIVARSDYFRYYVDKEEWGFALPALDHALQHFSSLEDHRSLDISAGILACRKLLRLPDHALAERARAALIQHRNPDGSWGRRNTPAQNRAHLTFVSILANLPFPAEFRTEAVRVTAGPGHD